MRDELITVKSRGQVTIPVEIRRTLNIEEGDILSCSCSDSGILVLRKHGSSSGGPLCTKETQTIIAKYAGMLTLTEPTKVFTGTPKHVVKEESAIDE